MTHDQVSLARDKLYSLLKEVRREAIPLVDAFDFPDSVLNSALGRYDGDVYNHLFQWAQKAPRNKKKVGQWLINPMICCPIVLIS
jgi:acyl-CoA oxidase